VVEITHLDMLNAHQIVEKYRENKLGFNDAIAYIGMKETNSTEIYTFINILTYFQILNA